MIQEDFQETLFTVNIIYAVSIYLFTIRAQDNTCLGLRSQNHGLLESFCPSAKKKKKSLHHFTVESTQIIKV